MAAVEMFQIEELDPRWIRPDLHLVQRGQAATPLRTGVSITERRAVRYARLRRRRRALVALGLLSGLAVLSWPGHAFGNTTGSGLPSDLATSSVLASGMQYVVQPNDTLQSIAVMVNPVSPSQASAALEREIGSTVVVPGEHIVIP